MLLELSPRSLLVSILLTSNKSFVDWGQILGDPILPTAFPRPDAPHSVVVNIRGGSCRLREKKAGVLATPFSSSKEVVVG